MLGWFVLTLLLGAGFLFFEIEEFIMYIGEGATIQTSAFLSGFFVLLGTHGAHVTGGIIWAICVIIQILKRGLTPVTARKVFIISLYWHFLDLVWVFIYTLVLERDGGVNGSKNNQANGHAHSGFPWSHVFGFILSLALTFLALYVALTQHCHFQQS